MLAEGLGLSGIVAILFCGIVSAMFFALATMGSTRVIFFQQFSEHFKIFFSKYVFFFATHSLLLFSPSSPFYPLQQLLSICKKIVGMILLLPLYSQFKEVRLTKFFMIYPFVHYFFTCS
jgi:NhaP-type Na+/H+ or K+/H+ antiporter